MHVVSLMRASIQWLIGRSLPAYLARGTASVALFFGGLAVLQSHPLLGMGMAFGSLIPIGGCPACWLGGTIGAACEYRPPRSPANEQP